jgi:hypothetical protein
VIPDEQTLKQACTRARAKALINEQIEAIASSLWVGMHGNRVQNSRF